jgi:hypothetical protein
MQDTGRDDLVPDEDRPVEPVDVVPDDDREVEPVADDHDPGATLPAIEPADGVGPADELPDDDRLV